MNPTDLPHLMKAEIKGGFNQYVLETREVNLSVHILHLSLVPIFIKGVAFFEGKQLTLFWDQHVQHELCNVWYCKFRLVHYCV